MFYFHFLNVLKLFNIISIAKIFLKNIFIESYFTANYKK